MNREAWLVFLGLLVAAVIGVVGVTAWQKDHQLKAAQGQLADFRRAKESEVAHLAEAWQEVENSRKRAESLAREMAAVTNLQKRFESEMRAALESREVAISELQGRLTLTILDRILFDSGDASLKPEGMQVLDKVAGVLAHYTNRPIQVIGHTDNIPIHLKYASNWELSTARAVAAVRYLTEKAGVSPERLSAVGCGEFQPIADNSSADGRSRNRRIALVVLPEMFAPTDVQSTNAPVSPGQPSSTETRSASPVATNIALGATVNRGTNESPEILTNAVVPETAPELSVSTNPVVEISE